MFSLEGARAYSRTSMSFGIFHFANRARIIGRVNGRRRLSTSEACGGDPITAGRSFWR